MEIINHAIIRNWNHWTHSILLPTTGPLPVCPSIHPSWIIIFAQISSRPIKRHRLSIFVGRMWASYIVYRCSDVAKPQNTVSSSRSKEVNPTERQLKTTRRKELSGAELLAIFGTVSCWNPSPVQFTGDYCIFIKRWASEQGVVFMTKIPPSRTALQVTLRAHRLIANRSIGNFDRKVSLCAERKKERRRRKEAAWN